MKYSTHIDSPAYHLKDSESSPFLSLPAALRKEIYLTAGLLSNEEIDLNGSRGYLYDGSAERPFQVSHDLILTCRTFYTDILPILYSTNAFYIRYRDKGNLERLRILSPHIIAHLTQLRIHLNESSQNRNPPYYPVDLRCLDDRPPLEASSHAVLEEWQTTASHIVAHMKPSTLRFFLICDSANIETAETVIKPLRTAPNFADFRIRLSLERNASLQQLANQISMRSMGYQYPSAQLPFRYLDLPLEIRFKNLEYTDLVTPRRQVQWSSEDKFHMYYSSSSCAIESIFYAQNRFVIIPLRSKRHQPVRSTPDRLDVSIFLRDFVSPEAVGFLKYFDIVIPPFYDDYLPFGPAYRDWVRTITHIGNLVNLPMLTLRVSMADINIEPHNAPEYRTRVHREECDTILMAYCRILKPLSRLRKKGLERFFVDLIPPTHRTPRFQRRQQDNPYHYCAAETRLRLWGERMVMGEEYDSEKLRMSKSECVEWRRRGDFE
ncbi:hypothetical protein LOCC1_G000341 [Lachnellula occidentalis]|uniref:DUF7730 domain-containing protein n=1 Tax=Lachnellula occidentalis TaxID=215460 RepID=A0A8H8SBK1_9HELO|nr:hypothetical protein LOCC1_G000341 [Lachnellula occidentalis]